jgi:hypothetical protein
VSNFTYSERWPTAATNLPPDVVTVLEARDRDLEQYLYGEPRSWAPTVWSFNVPPTVATQYTLIAARWERLRGRFCVGSVIAKKVSTPGGSTVLAIDLPVDAPPADPLAGQDKVPVGGTLQRYVPTLTPPVPTTNGVFVPWYAQDHTATVARWLVPFIIPGGAIFNDSMVSAANGDLLCATILWRTR